MQEQMAGLQLGKGDDVFDFSSSATTSTTTTRRARVVKEATQEEEGETSSMDTTQSTEPVASSASATTTSSGTAEETTRRVRATLNQLRSSDDLSITDVMSALEGESAIPLADVERVLVAMESENLIMYRDGEIYFI